MATVTSVALALNKKQNKQFDIALVGTAFIRNRTEVIIRYPATADTDDDAIYVWRGMAKNDVADGICRFKVKQYKDNKDKPFDDTADVSISVDASKVTRRVDLYEEDTP